MLRFNQNDSAAYPSDFLGGVPLAPERRISTLITCFGFAARCRGLQSPTSANPSRYKVNMVSLTPFGEPTTVNSTTSCSDTAAESSFGRSDLLSSGTNSCDILCSPGFGFSRKTQKPSRPAVQHIAGRLQRMLESSVSLQTAAFSLAVSCPLLLPTALGSATRFLGDAGCLIYKQATSHIKAEPQLVADASPVEL